MFKVGENELCCLMSSAMGSFSHYKPELLLFGKQCFQLLTGLGSNTGRGDGWFAVRPMLLSAACRKSVGLPCSLASHEAVVRILMLFSNGHVRRPLPLVRYGLLIPLDPYSVTLFGWSQCGDGIWGNPGSQHRV